MFDRFDQLARRNEHDTPAERDRYLDFLRVLAILVVVLGHWLARLVIEPDGELASGHLLAAVPATQWATWLVQVMPLFFIVGGQLNVRSWRRARQRGTSPVSWVRNRARRLLRPLIPLLVMWVALAAILAGAGLDDVLLFDPETAIIPVWFLAAYLLVTALTPVLADRADAWGLLALVAGAVAVDAVRFAQPMTFGWMPTIEGAPLFAVANFALVWLAVHQLGFWWSDGRVPQHPAAQWALTVAAVGMLTLLVAVAGYPASMVQVPGEAPANDAPPTIALFVLGVAQLGVALALRPAAERWLARTRVWGAVALLGSRLMTVFLWHQTAMLAVATLVVPTALWPTATAIDVQWWATRSLWIAACTAVLAPLIAVFARFENVDPPPDSSLPPRAAAALTAMAVLVTSASLGWLIVDGLSDPHGPLRLPAAPLVGILAGMAGLGVIGQQHTRRLAARFRMACKEDTAGSP